MRGGQGARRAASPPRGMGGVRLKREYFYIFCVHPPDLDPLTAHESQHRLQARVWDRADEDPTASAAFSPLARSSSLPFGL